MKQKQMNNQEREDFIGMLCENPGEEIYQPEVKILLMEAGLDEELAFYLARRIVNGAKAVVIKEAEKHTAALLHFIKAA